MTRCKVYAVAIFVSISSLFLLYSLCEAKGPIPNPNLDSELDRTFHSLTISKIAIALPGRAGNIHTHVEVIGVVASNRGEKDGDRHISLCEIPSKISIGQIKKGPCIVAECIPELPSTSLVCKSIRAGRHVKVKGISRYDEKHHWWEIHPVLSIEIVP